MLAVLLNLGFGGSSAASQTALTSLWHELRRRRILSRHYLPGDRGDAESTEAPWGQSGRLPDPLVEPQGG